MIWLPVSGLGVTLLPPRGQEDIILLEAPNLDASVALALLQPLAATSGQPLDTARLAVTDYEALLLALYAATFGDRIKATLTCSAPRCAMQSEISFGIADYIGHNSPHRPHGVTDGEKRGWFRLQAGDATLDYRLPTAGDLAATSGEPEPELAVLGRCVDGPAPRGQLRRRLEKAMEAQAPPLSGPMQARCPGCGAALDFFFDVQTFVLQALRDQAGFIYRDTHLLALHYHWPEGEILCMPRSRRIHYAEMLHGEAL
jgi:hypothetical protein